MEKNRTSDAKGVSQQSLRVAILGDSSTQWLSKEIKRVAADRGLLLEIFEADHGQVEMQILNPQSALHSFHAEFVIVFLTHKKMQHDFYTLLPDARKKFADDRITQFQNLFSQILSNVLFFNFVEEDDGTFGQYANKLESSFLYQIRKLNFLLMEISNRTKNLRIVDVKLLHQRAGDKQAFDLRSFVLTDMYFNLEFLPTVANVLVDLILTATGKVKKAIILDLDNTVWGGIIGDDGVSGIDISDIGVGKAFLDFQLWLLELRKRGILLTVCSKNFEEVAKEPFRSHPFMKLRLEDIAVFISNWSTKAENILQIQKTLNIGFDSLVFIDDNPFEREQVRRALPDVCVPEMPEDPAEYIDYLKSLNLFETSSLTTEDVERTKLYEQEGVRKQTRTLFESEDDYLNSLNMTSAVVPFNAIHLQRIVQLIQRSNQFNLRTIRYSENELVEMMSSSKFLTFQFTLRDNFGDSGLIALVILKISKDQAFVDTWLMSCRVLGRGMEAFTLNAVARACAEAGLKQLIGEYVPTAKNILVKDHYKNLGFMKIGNRWRLDISTFRPLKTFITAVEND